MKIAIQLFGHMRTFEQCAPSLKKNLLDLYDCDIFIHTWSTTDHAEPVAYESTHQSKELLDTYFYDKITSLYSPKKFHIQEQLSFFKSHLDKKYKPYDPAQRATIDRAHNMLHSMFSVNQTRIAYSKESGEIYDYVIFIRPDILLREKFNIDKYSREFSYLPNSLLSFINTPVITRKNTRFDINYFANDIFFFLRSDFADNFLNIDCYYKLDFGNYGEIFPESKFSTAILFHEYLLKESIIPRYYNFPYSIIRDNSTANIHLGEDLNKELVSTFILEDQIKTKKYKRLTKILFALIALLLFLILILLQR